MTQTVADLMERDVPSCTPWMLLDDAVGLMRRRGRGVLPVVDSGEDRVVGMLTDRDVCLEAHRRERRLLDVRVESAMSSGVAACRSEQPLDEALEVMRAAGVTRLPVVDAGGRLAGLLSLDAVARRAARGGPDAEERLAAVARTVADVRPWA